MSAPPSSWKSNTAFNKFNPSYFNGDVDASQNVIIRNGNLYVASNSSIYSTANQMFFDDVYAYINFYQNIHIYGLLQLDWGGYTHDVGTDLYGSVLPTLTNIFYDGLTTNTNLGGLFTFSGSLNGVTPTTFGYLDATSSIQSQLNSLSTSTSALTNISFNSGTNTTSFTGNLSFPTTSINSASIQNNNFLALTGAQSCSGNKTFAGNIICSASGNGNFNGLLQSLGAYLRVDGELHLNSNALVISQATLQNLQYLSTTTSDIQTQLNSCAKTALTNTFSQQQTLSNNLRLDGSLLVGSAGATILSNATLEKIQYLSGVSASIQGTLDNCAKIGISNTFSQQQVFSNASNSIRIDGAMLVSAGTLSIPNATLAKTQYLSTVSSDIQTQINGCAKPNVNNNFSVSQTITSNLRLDGNLLVGSAGGTSISNTILTYLSGLTSNIQTQINNISTANFVSLATTQVISGLKTFSSLITANGGITTGAAAITTPSITSTTDLRINSANATTLYLNNDKTSGDTRINTGSASSNTYIDNGFLNISQSVTGGSTVFKAATGILTGGGGTDFCEVVSLATGNYGLQLQGGIKQGVGDQFNLAFNNGGTPINLLTAVNTGTPATNALNLTGKLIINGIDILNYQPLGTIIQNVSGSLGSPYLLCDGSAVSRTTYSALFALIGTNYSAGDGSTTFGLPNYQGMFLRGQGTQTQNSVAYSSATNPYTFQADALQDHNHGGQSGTYLASTNGSVSGTYGWNAVASQRPNSNTFTNTSGVTAAYRSSTETRPANFSVWYYIRAL